MTDVKMSQAHFFCWILRKHDLQEERFDGEKLQGKEGNYLITAVLSAPAAFQPSSQHPHFHPTEIWGAEARQEPCRSLARGWVTAAARPPGPEHTTLLLQVHLARARKLRPKQRLLCLHRSSASLPGFASYFKVIAPSGRLKSKFKGRR